MSVRPEEVTSVLQRELEAYEKEIDLRGTGTVLQVGDGIARVYGLADAMMSELVEFANGVFGVV